jgi:hypothetical protein
VLAGCVHAGAALEGEGLAQLQQWADVFRITQVRFVWFWWWWRSQRLFYFFAITAEAGGPDTETCRKWC